MRHVDVGDDLDRLHHAIRDELAAQYGIRGLPVEDRLLDSLADMLVSQIDYGFDVRWAPKWVRPGEPHRWQEGDEYFIECVPCRIATAHRTSDQAECWYQDHLSSHP